MSKESDLVGSTGLFAAAYELARNKWLVSPTFGSAARTDLLAQHTETDLTAAIQVKTRTSGDFHLAVSDPSLPGANEWVILVSLGDRTARPAFNVVPRNHVCLVVRVLGDILEEQERRWPRKLIGEQEFCRYRGAWELMTRPAGEIPWMLPQWVFDGLPHHPQPELSPPAEPAPDAP
jgi:hypothetical protein